jgi:phosphoglycerate dehydrogenase-like enzyme
MPKRPGTRPPASTPSIAFLAAVGLSLAALAAEPAREPASSAQLISDLGLHVDAHPVRERSGWRPPRKILVAVQIHDQMAVLRAVAPNVKLIELSANTPERDIAEADGAIGVCSADIVARAKNLQWIQWLGAGVERCVQQDLIRERRPLITNLQRAAGGSMAEHVMAMMLILSRNLTTFFIDQQHAHWASESDTLPVIADLDGKTVLVVGLGGIGTEVAKRAHAFGMRVIATRASGRTGPDYVSYVGLPEELLTLTKQADFVVNCAPLTPATTGIFNAQFFAAMKPTAYFVSVGRGRSTVTTDLVAALKEHRIAGAGLDVTDPEPLPPDHPLWALPGVVITPHVSGYTPLADEMRTAIVRENLRRYVAGEPMLSVVDIDKGY